MNILSGVAVARPELVVRLVHTAPAVETVASMTGAALLRVVKTVTVIAVALIAIVAMAVALFAAHLPPQLATPGGIFIGLGAFMIWARWV